MGSTSNYSKCFLDGGSRCVPYSRGECGVECKSLRRDSLGFPGHPTFEKQGSGMEVHLSLEKVSEEPESPCRISS